MLKLPEIFIFQLKRFSPSMKKIRTPVEFGEYLNMEPFIEPQYAMESSNRPLLYQLVSVTVHLGTMRSGHYIAYTLKEDGLWYKMDDERVAKVSTEEVLRCDAYLLFYRKVNE